MKISKIKNNLKKLVTLKDNVPIENKIESFDIKPVEKNKLYDFLREMEFNRLLSQAIDFYGEPDEKNINKNNKKTSDKSISNENIKDKKQTKKTSDQNKKSKQTDEVRNENYIGAPVADSKKTKDKKTGWWNK